MLMMTMKMCNQVPQIVHLISASLLAQSKANVRKKSWSKKINRFPFFLTWAAFNLKEILKSVYLLSRPYSANLITRNWCDKTVNLLLLTLQMPFVVIQLFLAASRRWVCWLREIMCNWWSCEFCFLFLLTESKMIRLQIERMRMKPRSNLNPQKTCALIHIYPICCDNSWPLHIIINEIM